MILVGRRWSIFKDYRLMFEKTAMSGEIYINWLLSEA